MRMRTLSRAVANAIATCAIAFGGLHFLDCAAAPGPDPKPAMFGDGMSSPLSNLGLEKLHDVSERDRQKTQADSRAMLASLQLSCEPAAVEHVAHGTSTSGNAKADIDIYEVACRNGPGFLLASQGADQPFAMTCFAAEAAHAASGPRVPGTDFACELPPNRDAKALAASLLTASGVSCPVRELRWFGVNATLHLDYSEVACADGSGYLIKIATAGSAPVAAMSCRDAAGHGLRCHLTDAGPVSAPVTLQTLRDAVKTSDLHCEPTDLRLVGRESVSRRYVVELRCPDQPLSQVAFIPVGDNTAKFETMGCAAAGAHNIACQLNLK